MHKYRLKSSRWRWQPHKHENDMRIPQYQEQARKKLRPVTAINNAEEVGQYITSLSSCGHSLSACLT